mgnify:CR=1 FL=1|jgi:hypothetical protein
MKFRFESSDKIYNLTTTASTVSQDEFKKLLYDFIFKGKDPTCSFEVTNCNENESITCDTDIPIVKKGYAKLFQQPSKLEMTKQKTKPKRRWRSRSPVQRQTRVRRWRSRSPKTKRIRRWR